MRTPAPDNCAIQMTRGQRRFELSYIINYHTERVWGASNEYWCSDPTRGRENQYYKGTRWQTIGLPVPPLWEQSKMDIFETIFVQSASEALKNQYWCGYKIDNATDRDLPENIGNTIGPSFVLVYRPIQSMWLSLRIYCVGGQNVYLHLKTFNTDVWHKYLNFFISF